MATSKKNTAAEAAGQAATRMDALRQIKSPWGYAEIAHAMGVDIETARRWAHDGRKARDEKVAEHYGVTLDDVRGWRRTTRAWRDKAAAVDLDGVGVGYHMLPEATHRLGGSDGWDRDVILAWGRTAFDGSDRTRLNAKGEASQLVPTGRPPGIKETRPRAPRRPGRDAERDKVVKAYTRLVGKGKTDTQARGQIADDQGISRKQVSRYLVEARAMPDKYGDIPTGSPARGTRQKIERGTTAPATGRRTSSGGRKALTA